MSTDAFILNELIVSELKELRREIGEVKQEISAMKESVSKIIGQQVNRTRRNSLEQPIQEETFTAIHNHIQRRNTDTMLPPKSLQKTVIRNSRTLSNPPKRSNEKKLPNLINTKKDTTNSIDDSETNANSQLGSS